MSRISPPDREEKNKLWQVTDDGPLFLRTNVGRGRADGDLERDDVGRLVEVLGSTSNGDEVPCGRGTRAFECRDKVDRGVLDWVGERREFCRQTRWKLKIRSLDCARVGEKEKGDLPTQAR